MSSYFAPIMNHNKICLKVVKPPEINTGSTRNFLKLTAVAFWVGQLAVYCNIVRQCKPYPGSKTGKIKQ